jgi:hypothetical protein
MDPSIVKRLIATFGISDAQSRLEMLAVFGSLLALSRSWWEVSYGLNRLHQEKLGSASSGKGSDS